MENLPDTVKDVLTTVMKKKYKVKVFDRTVEKYDIYEWNIGELNTFLISSKIEEIHLFKTEIIDDLTLEGRPK